MPLLFASSLFVAAALAFVVQPLIGRQLLPLAGGAAAVWTTCLVFFQIMLLAGYLYSHLTAKLPHRAAYLIHTALLVAAMIALMNENALAPSPAIGDWIEEAPVAALAVGLLFAVGLPYFALATTAPLMQAWFARTGRDPYWLYAASNAGSLLGLLAYPFLFEPNWTIASQRYFWRIGFTAAASLIIICGFLSRNATRTLADMEVANDASPIPGRRRWQWIGLSALTASLLASVTAHLSTDIAPMPLLWVVPLSLYLLTYIITFARWPDAARRIVGRLAPMMICFVVIALLSQATEPMVLVAAVHLAGLTVICLLCHGELAADKPAPRHLTDFYLCIALGGVLGGSFNAILAPMIFAHLGPVEYPLALVLAALVRPRIQNGGQCPPYKIRIFDVFAPIFVLILTLVLGIAVPAWLETPNAGDEAAKLLDRVIRGGLMYGVPVAVSFALVWRPLRFALCIAAVLVVGIVMRSQTNHTLAVERNFFGTLTVTRSGEFMVLTHGTTRHGEQRLGEEPPAPAMYYHRRGPLGSVFQKPAQRVGVVGLGCGAMAAYAEPGQAWTFFEIDPLVVRIAEDDRYFTFLSQCRVKPGIVLGDARRKLAEVPDGAFDLLAIDAFNSDAVPVHLLTREAFELYLRKLAPHGRLIMHLSNRYLDLASLAGRGLESLDEGLAVRWCDDRVIDDEDRANGKLPSIWLIAARQASDIGKLPLFTPLHPNRGPIWTDDYAPLRGVWKQSDE